MKTFLRSLPRSRKQLSQLLLFQGPFLRSYPLSLFFLSSVTSDFCFLFQAVLSRAIAAQTLSKDTPLSKVPLSLPSICLPLGTALVFYFLFRPSQAGFVVLWQRRGPWGTQLSSTQSASSKILRFQEPPITDALSTRHWGSRLPANFSSFLLERLGLGELGSCISRPLS